MFQIIINGNIIYLYESFTVSKSLANFVDTFRITLSNPKGLFSTTIPIGSYINVYYNEIEIFRGICEKKEVTYSSVGSMLTFSGREELLVLTEDDITPLHKDYKKVSDNFIIEDICKGLGWKFSLTTPKIISEYEISNNGIRKGQVLEDVVSMNNFYLYKIGGTIYKKELPKEADYKIRKRPQFTLSSQGGTFTDFNNRILDVSISEDISRVKSIIKGFTYGTGKAKPKIYSTIQNERLLNGTYPQKLRNIGPKLTGPTIGRYVSKSIQVKSKAELNGILQKVKVEQDIQIDITITVAEFLDLHMLDTVEIFIQDENIKQYMYIKELSYNYDKSNKFYTSFTFSPIEPKEILA